MRHVPVCPHKTPAFTVLHNQMIRITTKSIQFGYNNGGDAGVNSQLVPGVG
jgi:hypothetical protein